MSDFDPAKLAAAQSDEIEIRLPRRFAALIGQMINDGLELAPDDVVDQDTIDDGFELADRLINYGRTGIDHPDACFCIRCGQPDEPELHDPERCSLALLQRQA